MACHRPVLQQFLAAIEAAGLKPIAVDVEPLALLRCYGWQFRRDEDRQQRAMFVHVGAGSTAVVIARGGEPLFIKYIELGGQHFDLAVAKHLKMELPAAASLRRHNGDRRADQQDPEITRSVQEGTRPVLEKLAGELSMCVRYHSVTFRGQPIVRVVVGGGEAAGVLAEELGVGSISNANWAIRFETSSWPSKPAAADSGIWPLAWRCANDRSPWRETKLHVRNKKPHPANRSADECSD